VFRRERFSAIQNLQKRLSSFGRLTLNKLQNRHLMGATDLLPYGKEIQRSRQGERAIKIKKHSLYSFRLHASLLQFLFKEEALFAVLAELPYKALSSELTISARICAGFTVVEAFPAVTYQHLLAGNVSIAIRVVLALHDTPWFPLPLQHGSKSRGLQVSNLFVIDHKANRFIFEVQRVGIDLWRRRVKVEIDRVLKNP
jgi:hypothetical protein